MSTIPILLTLASIVLLYSSMLVIFGIGTSCLVCGDLICVADLVEVTGLSVDGFTGNKQAGSRRLYYPPLM